MSIPEREVELDVDLNPDIHSGAGIGELGASAVDEALVELAPTAVGTPKARGTWQLYLRRFRRNRTAMAGLVIFALLALFATFGELIAPYDYLNTDFMSLTAPPRYE
ncbi:hypothetical protein [Microbacterium sp.]|uniref:hypothetical protein n=1 Tax=Microbacterium sp. TaxID=51671 RepID=UPI003C7205C6